MQRQLSLLDTLSSSIMKSKCIIVLSEKSSGSSALQNLLSRHADIKHIEKTRHYENESLYWTKAASALGMSQENMLSSEVPIPADKAKEDIANLLRDNLRNNPPFEVFDENFIFKGWKLLCEQYSPIFFEKSPHHLLQWSSIELIIRAANEIKNVDFLVVGLVRNPMDVLYSHYKRWGIDPDRMQNQWVKSYSNLNRLENMRHEVNFEFIVLKYEDIVTSNQKLKSVLNFCNVDIQDLDDSFLHQNSIGKWKKDSSYGFSLSDNAYQLARRFGYEKKSLANDYKSFWRVKKHLRVRLLSLAIIIKRIAKGEV